MTRLAEQSNVPFVFTRRIVGMPAFAITLRGEYPPFAEMSIICRPSTMKTAGTPPPPSPASDPEDTNQNAPPMRSPLMATETNIDLFILEVEERIDNAGRGERVREIEYCERDDGDAGRLEENPPPRLVRDIERTE